MCHCGSSKSPEVFAKSGGRSHRQHSHVVPYQSDPSGSPLVSISEHHVECRNGPCCQGVQLTSPLGTALGFLCGKPTSNLVESHQPSSNCRNPIPPFDGIPAKCLIDKQQTSAYCSSPFAEPYARRMPAAAKSPQAYLLASIFFGASIFSILSILKSFFVSV